MRTVAGDFSAGPDICDLVDGVGTDVRFHGTRALTYFRGYVYFLDACFAVLRRFDPITNEVVTIAGAPTSPTNPVPPGCPVAGTYLRCNEHAATDDFGSAAHFVSPRYIASDGSGMLYITDTNGETIPW